MKKSPIYKFYVSRFKFCLSISNENKIVSLVTFIIQNNTLGKTENNICLVLLWLKCLCQSHLPARRCILMKASWPTLQEYKRSKSSEYHRREPTQKSRDQMLKIENRKIFTLYSKSAKRNESRIKIKLNTWYSTYHFIIY